MQFIKSTKSGEKETKHAAGNDEKRGIQLNVSRSHIISNLVCICQLKSYIKKKISVFAGRAREIFFLPFFILFLPEKPKKVSK